MNRELTEAAVFICHGYPCYKPDAFLSPHPEDITFEKAQTLLGLLSYERSNKGKTSGSRVIFTSKEHHTKILLHKPHPRKELLPYQVKQLIEELADHLC